MDLPSDFCPDCGNIVDMPKHGDVIECNKCKGKFSILDYPCKPVVSRIELTEKKAWLEQYYQSIDKN